MNMSESAIPRSARRSKIKDLAERWTFMLPSAVLLIVMLAYPIFYSIEISLSSFDLSTFGAGEWVGWENYEEVLTDYRFWDALKITLIYLAFALPLQIILGFGIAFLINAEWRGRGVTRALFIIPMVVAPVVAGGLWRMILDPLWGLLNYGFGVLGFGPYDWFGNSSLAMASIIVIDTWRWTPFVVLIATAALLALPKDVLEAAKIDGAGWWATLWSVVLPLLVPIIAATFVIRWLGAVKMFDIVLASTQGGPGKSTNVINLFIYEEAFRSLKFAVSAAMSIVVLVLTMIFTAIFLRISRKIEDLY